MLFSDKVDELGVYKGRGEGGRGGGAPGVLEGGRLRGKGREREKKEEKGGGGDLEHQGKYCPSPKGFKVQIETKGRSHTVRDK